MKLCLAQKCTVTGFGWVQNISSGLTSAEPQTEVEGVEGETVSLSLFYTKNNPITSLRVIFDLQTSGSATGIATSHIRDHFHTFCIILPCSTVQWIWTIVSLWVH